MDCRTSNRLLRFRLDAGLWGWSYSFHQRACEVPCIALGLEIGVTLEGERRWASERGRASTTGHRVAVFDLGERYTTAYEPSAFGGREIGVVLRLDQHPRFRLTEELVSFPRHAGVDDPHLAEVFRDVARALDRGAAVDGARVAGEVNAFVERHAIITPADALGRARLAIHTSFDKPLYMRHFAEIAGVHEATFTRRFAARFGITPTRYRTRLRLSESTLLLATRPDLTVRQIAARVGFEDVPYFHRAFVREFGTTPLSLARDFLAPERGLRPPAPPPPPPASVRNNVEAARFQ